MATATFNAASTAPAPSQQNTATTNPTITIFDFGSQYSHLIARRVREIGVYCELLSCTTRLCDLGYKPIGIILSGSPHSVYEPDSPHADPDIFSCGIPVLGICYGLQEIVWAFGGKVSQCAKREYGRATLKVPASSSSSSSTGVRPCPLFDGFSADSSTVWMSHGDYPETIPDCFRVVASSESTPNCALEHVTLPIYGVQFHPEVTHSSGGAAILSNFARRICGAEPKWTMESFVEPAIDRIRSIVGPVDHVVGAVSGGVDSTVAARLLHLAIGDRFHAILVDNGLMRQDEAARTLVRLRDELKLNVSLVDAAEMFYARLHNVEEPEAKRRIIGNTFIDVFESEAERIGSSAVNSGAVRFLLQGTLYPDVIESASYKGPSATIKSHHNVGGLKDKMKLQVIEPLRDLFKDEVRALGAVLGIDRQHLWRHPFPGPGLAIRIIGAVTPESVRIVQHADEIYITEIRRANLYDKISQAYAALLPFKSVGVMGDQRTYEQTICLRAVETSDFMTADWFSFPPEVMRHISNRIINEVKGVNRVMYDVSSKPPATIELE